MQPQIRTEWNITIYPQGMGWGEDNPARIYFQSAKAKVRYVELERKFCSLEMSRFNGSVSRKDREENRKTYLKKRSFFAVQQGYSPSMRDNSMWFFKAPTGKVTA